MTLAISEDHRALADTVGSLMERHNALGASRELLNGAEAALPSFWKEAAELGWMGLHLPEAHGGSGYGLAETAIVLEGMGRVVAPGPLLPTVVVSAVVARCGTDEQRARLLPGLADGSTVATFTLGGSMSVSDGAASGDVGPLLNASLAQIALMRIGDDVAIVHLDAEGVTITDARNIDLSRPASTVVLQEAQAELLVGAGTELRDVARALAAAEAIGVAGACTELAAEYAKERKQFGRVIAAFQAVKHHCANMLVATELATAEVWDACRASDAGGAAWSIGAAMSASLALPAADFCAQHSIQVHGGIGFTWEHDAHLYLRRATALGAIVDAEASARDVADLARDGARGKRSIELPPEAEPFRIEARAFAERIKGLDASAQRTAMIDDGYAVPHWPKPWGREAKAVEQLVIEEEFALAGLKRPAYAITGWVILTLVQHATADQVARWVRPALDQEVTWCQLFSEPDAGSDAAAVKAKAVRVDGGWKVTGQKVWTSGAHVARYGFATVRTNFDVAKHAGVTTMVIDMHAPGVEVRPLRQITGDSDFNEVFFDEVFVSDDDVVGPIDGGWAVARATLGNESVSIGGGDGGMALPPESIVAAFDTHPERLAGGAGRVGRYVSRADSIQLLNLRSAYRAVAGEGPGPEGAVTKLVLSENLQEAAEILTGVHGPDALYLEGPGMMAGYMMLVHRAMSIAGGTSEIKRNQIGERILGLPRDPLVS